MEVDLLGEQPVSVHLDIVQVTTLSVNPSTDPLIVHPLLVVVIDLRNKFHV